MRWSLKYAAVSLQRGLDQQEEDLDGDVEMGDYSCSGCDGDKSKWEISALMLEVIFFPADDQRLK